MSKPRQGSPTALVRAIHDHLLRMKDEVIANLDKPERPTPCPGLDENELPKSDLSGQLVVGDDFAVEVDDTSEPGANITKYWLRVEASSTGATYAPLRLLTIASSNSSVGSGYLKRARFYGRQLEKWYPDKFCFDMTELRGKEAETLAKEIVAFLKRPWPETR